jgi:Outer membrane protein beta-barrel domain
MKKSFGIAVALLVSAPLFAQEVQRFTFNVGGGFTNPVGGTGRRLDTGWNADIGAGINFNAYVGALVQANFSENGINDATLANIGFPGGNVRLAAFTLNPIVHVAPHSPVDIYLIGGGGLYHRTQEFTTPGVASFVGFDPFFGFFQQNVPVNQVVSSYTVNKPGVNGGMGISFGGYRRAKFYAEARYHRMFLGNDRHYDIVPVTFGVRF